MAVAATFVLLAAPARGAVAQQFFDPDRCIRCADKGHHVLAGAGIVLTVRGPWVAESWGDTALKRIAWVGVIGAAYEMVQVVETHRLRRSGVGHGFGVLDLLADVAGAATMELLVAVTRTLFR